MGLYMRCEVWGERVGHITGTLSPCRTHTPPDVTQSYLDNTANPSMPMRAPTDPPFMIAPGNSNDAAPTNAFVVLMNAWNDPLEAALASTPFFFRLACVAEGRGRQKRGGRGRGKAEKEDERCCQQ